MTSAEHRRHRSSPGTADDSRRPGFPARLQNHTPCQPPCHDLCEPWAEPARACRAPHPKIPPRRPDNGRRTPRVRGCGWPSPPAKRGVDRSATALRPPGQESCSSGSPKCNIHHDVSRACTGEEPKGLRGGVRARPGAEHDVSSLTRTRRKAGDLALTRPGCASRGGGRCAGLSRSAARPWPVPSAGRPPLGRAGPTRSDRSTL